MKTLQVQTWRGKFIAITVLTCLNNHIRAARDSARPPGVGVYSSNLTLFWALNCCVCLILWNMIATTLSISEHLLCEFKGGCSGKGPGGSISYVCGNLLLVLVAQEEEREAHGREVELLQQSVGMKKKTRQLLLSCNCNRTARPVSNTHVMPRILV